MQQESVGACPWPVREQRIASMTGRLPAPVLAALLACASPAAGPIHAAMELAAVQDQGGSREQERPAEQDELEEPPAFEEQVVVVGTRAEPRTATASPVPVDAIPARDIVSQGDNDLANQIRNVVPSFNVADQPISVGLSIVRPAALRNLAADHTLVLVNGNRRHRSSIVGWVNGATDGVQGPDISAIPSIALRQVEVLRDGASAQYGSDAIAGILNLQLKDAPSGGSLEVSTGAFGAGDGETYAVAGNVGLPLGRTGFASLSLEYGNANPTNRGVQRADAAALIAAGNTAVSDLVQPWGRPEIDDNLKLFGNFGHLFTNGLQVYGHSSYAQRLVTVSFFFRNPNTRMNIFTADGGRTLLVGDALAARGGESANCPTVAIVDNVPDPVGLGAMEANPNCFSFQDHFPGGFTPRFGAAVQDYSAVGGLRGFTAAGLTWDASASIGSHESDFFIDNTVNASLGALHPSNIPPTSFDPGAYRQQEIGLNFDVSYPLTDMINIAAGGEWREEQFTVGEGARDSWQVGPYAAQGFVSGANGFPGFSDVTSGVFDRRNLGLYADVEVRGAEDDWTLGTAIRIERFDLFGATMNSKLAGRYRLAGPLALRASVSSGFRAPTPGQQNAYNVQTGLNEDLQLIDTAVVPSTSVIARFRGGEALQAERSVNYAAGAVVDAGEFSLTADYFRIDLADRMALTQSFVPTRAEVQSLLAQGLAAASGLQEFRFFTNDFSTTTQGLDVVASWTPAVLGSDTTLNAAFNHVGTEVTGFDPDLLNTGDVLAVERATPNTRWIASVAQRVGRARLLGRLQYYGAWVDVFIARQITTGPVPTTPHFDGNNYIVDLEVSLDLGAGATLAVGGQNVFDVYSETNPFTAARIGMPYSMHTPWGMNGAYYYGRITYGW